MPAHRFQKGQSGNPSGRPKSFLSKAVKEDQFLKSFGRLIQIRDGQILERKVAGTDADGNPIYMDVVPSIKDVLNACKLLLAYTGGLPVQQVELPNAPGSVRINILLGNQIFLENQNGSQPRLYLDGQSDTIDSRALPGGDSDGTDE